MKSLTLIFAVLLFTVSMFAQSVAPTLCTSCKYGYELKGTRTLVGAKRNYFGSAKTTTTTGFNFTPATTDTKMKLQDVFPQMDSVWIFWNYSPNGVGHLTELTGNIEVFVRNGNCYAWACGNLLEITEKPLSPAPVIHRERLTVYDTVYQPVVLKPMTVKLQLCTASYINGCHQQTFFHGVQEFTLTTLPYDGEYVYGKKFVTEIPKFIPSCGGIKITDYFWTTAN